MRNLLFVTFFLFTCFRLCAQFTDSNLPIVIIATNNNVTIPDQPRILANMKIIDRGPGQRNYMADQNDASKLNYNGKIKIEIRGSSSQALPKKQYGLTTVQADNVTNNNVSLLGMPRENDWVLNGLAFDPSLIRDYLSYNLSAQLGNYAPRQRYCEVVINNSYQGLYILQEKVKIDDNRVNITKLDPADRTLPKLSGGYLTKADKVTADDPSAWTMPTYINNHVDFIHESPKPTLITPEQHSFIYSLFTRLSSASNNISVANGYPSIIDVPSFVDFMLVNELSANVDAYQFSTFFHKDRNGKLRAGPLWDHNLTYGNDLFMWGLDRSKTFTWQFDNGDNVGPRFWRDLFNNSTFRCYLSKRWNEATASGQPLNLAQMSAFIDETVATISEAVVREHERWGTIGNHNVSIAAIKSFLSDRIVWMNSNLGSFTACSNVITPPLVITRIHYHPSTSGAFPKDDDQEFIEIVNNSDKTVSLSGVYFSGTGFVFQFPDGAALPAHAIIQLANDTKVFIKRYGYVPYGEFTRNLSNASQKLTLADAFGNVIDEVHYTDAPPWPNADGNGLHLKLIDPSLDNSVASNWIAVNEEIYSTEIIMDAEDDELAGITVFPNPSDHTIRVTSPVLIRKLSLTDVQGRKLDSIQVNNKDAAIDLIQYPPGVYMLRIDAGNRSVVRKVMRK